MQGLLVNTGRVAVPDAAAIAAPMSGTKPPYTTRSVAADDAGIAAARDLLNAGAVVAVPTETVYGLAGDATRADAIAAIYVAKGRPSFNPLIVHVADFDMARQFGLFDALAERLARHFWPGALTLVVPVMAASGIAPAVTAGLATIALRCPAHPAMRRLILALGRPLAAPSANVSGSVSPTTAAHVLHTLSGRIPLVVDAGACAGGIESTIIAVADGTVTLLRPGPITGDEIAAVANVAVHDHDGQTIVAPGQLTRHYAPGKPVRLNNLGPAGDAFVISFGRSDGDFALSPKGDLTEAARNLFAALHAGAQSAKDSIAVDPVPDTGLGMAINDRLRRAAA